MPAPALVLMLLVALPAAAQVHKCIDAVGKTAFSDTPCPSNAKSAARILDSSATERRPEEEATAAERNLRSIENATRIIREPTSDVMRGAGDAGIIDADPNERIRSQDKRNMQRRMAEIEAGRARAEDRAARAEAARAAAARAPAIVTNCNSSGCWDTGGNRYNRTGDGQNFWRSDGKFCRSTGNAFICN